ncbi:MAG: hypothetical protein Q9227_003067 [Pyrenula ochraceoflavens]
MPFSIAKALGFGTVLGSLHTILHPTSTAEELKLLTPSEIRAAKTLTTTQRHRMAEKSQAVASISANAKQEVTDFLIPRIGARNIGIGMCLLSVFVTPGLTAAQTAVGVGRVLLCGAVVRVLDAYIWWRQGKRRTTTDNAAVVGEGVTGTVEQKRRVRSQTIGAAIAGTFWAVLGVSSLIAARVLGKLEGMDSRAKERYTEKLPLPIALCVQLVSSL